MLGRQEQRGCPPVPFSLSYAPPVRMGVNMNSVSTTVQPAHFQVPGIHNHIYLLEDFPWRSRGSLKCKEPLVTQCLYTQIRMTA